MTLVHEHVQPQNTHQKKNSGTTILNVPIIFFNFFYIFLTCTKTHKNHYIIQIYNCRISTLFTTANK